jgi:cell division protein FtsI (penicillin-binding protein 3)
MKKQDKKSAILGKYGIVVVFLLLFAVMIFVSAGSIVFSPDREKWIAVGASETVRGNRAVLPRRGNIYTHDGRLLAASEPSYTITIDFKAQGLREDSLMQHVNALAETLARNFPNRTAAQYRSLIVNGLQQREERRHVRLITRDINFVELKEIRACPIWRQSTLRSGLVATERNARVKPFGNLATRTVGNVFADLESGGSSGLELRFDSLLRGVSGERHLQRIPGGFINVEVTPAQDGYDIVTTIDAEIQEITERALRDMLIETSAASGTAIVMEVQSGKIRGVSNLDRVRPGEYAERGPNAFSFMHEPGSTFKTIATLIALEDGVVQPTDTFFVGNGVWQPSRHLTVTDWNARRVNRGYMTVQEGMEMSSNVVMARMLLDRYGDNQARFIEGLDRIGLHYPLTWDVPLQGREGTMRVHRPGETGWSNFTSLGVMSFGYATEIPPIRMLMFHNAIANGGKMIQPFVAQRIVRDGRTVQEFSAHVVNPQIASRRTIGQIHDMLVGVTESEIGTGSTFIRSDYFRIAGKTGTAQLSAGGGYGAGHFVSFVGYFPADNPQYSIFVGVRNPQVLHPSGARHAGVVFRNIAEQIFVRNERLSVNHVRIDTTLATEPRLKNGKWRKNRTLLAALQLPVSSPDEATDWVRMQIDSIGHRPQPLSVEPGIVPDVRGMGARDAVYLLEKSGLRVNLSGSGRVATQSLSPGSRLARGTVVSIVLR